MEKQEPSPHSPKYREGFCYVSDISYNRLRAIYCQEEMNVSSAKRNIPKDIKSLKSKAVFLSIISAVFEKGKKV